MLQKKSNKSDACVGSERVSETMRTQGHSHSSQNKLKPELFKFSPVPLLLQPGKEVKHREAQAENYWECLTIFNCQVKANPFYASFPFWTI